MRLSTSKTAANIASQPEAWISAGALAATDGDVFRLPGRVAIIGCGSSWNVAMAIAALREDLGYGETDSFPASEARLDRAYDRVVAISRSGVTTEIVQALATAPASATTVALVGQTPSQVSDACDETVELDFAAETEVVQTRFVTSTVAFARASLGTDALSLAEAGTKALTDPLTVDPTAFGHYVFLGCGWCVGLAGAAALMMRECAGAWSEAYPAMEYRHGPVAAANASTLVWIIGTPPSGLVAEVNATGATVVQSERDPLATVVECQRAAVALAEARGRDVDTPPHLSRAVVLDQ